LEIANNQWPVTLWDATFTTQIDQIGPLAPCASQQFGVRVEVPNTTTYVQDTAVIRARSQTDSLVTASSLLSTDNAAPDVAAGPDMNRDGISGEPVTYTLHITNSGNITDVYDVSLSQNSWPTTFVPPLTQTPPLPPGQSLILTAVTTIPTGTPAGQSDPAVFDLVSQNYPSVADAAILTTNAKANVAVSWDVDLQQSALSAGLTASYFVTVRNDGNQNDVFRLQLIGQDWPTTVTDDSFTQLIAQTAVLAPNETQRIGVRVQIPDTANPPEQDGLMIRAVSLLDNSVSDYTMLVTVVAGAASGVELTPIGDWQLSQAGATVPYNLLVTNTGTTAESYDVTVLTAEWQVDVVTAIGPIAPGDTAALALTVTVPMTAAEGAWDEAVMAVSAVGNSAVSDQATLFTLLPGNPMGSPPLWAGALYLPIAVKP
jgi:uncharacterized membrane protein